MLLPETKKADNIKFLLLFFILFLLYFSPYIIKGKACFIPIHDNLNQINMLGIFDGKFEAELLPAEGDPEFTLPGTETIFHLAQIKLDKLFFRSSYFSGYIINEVLARILGFLGFFLLIRFFIAKKELPDIFNGLLAFTFTTQPFWPAGYISIAGIPFLIISFISLCRNKKLILSYLYIIFYSFYSNFFLSGIYIFIILLIISIYLIITRKFSFHFLLGIIIFCISTIITHLAVFLNFFFKTLIKEIIQMVKSRYQRKEFNTYIRL